LPGPPRHGGLDRVQFVGPSQSYVCNVYTVNVPTLTRLSRLVGDEKRAEKGWVKRRTIKRV